MNIKDGKKFGAIYTVTKIDDCELIKTLEWHFEKVFDLAKLKLGNYGKEVSEIIKKYPTLGRKKVYTNLVPNVLRYQLARLISGTSVTPTFKANKLCLGDDNTAVVHTNTQLGNEVSRSDFSNRYSQFHVAYLDKFFGSSEVGGNSYYEAGVFVDGTATVNSGFLLSHVNIDETMTATESLTINISFSILDS